MTCDGCVSSSRGSCASGPRCAIPLALPKSNSVATKELDFSKASKTLGDERRSHSGAHDLHSAKRRRNSSSIICLCSFSCEYEADTQRPNSPHRNSQSTSAAHPLETSGESRGLPLSTDFPSMNVHKLAWISSNCRRFRSQRMSAFSLPTVAAWSVTPLRKRPHDEGRPSEHPSLSFPNTPHQSRDNISIPHLTHEVPVG
mmetsp:Transcript_124907/g.364794  ORF Transcript_124907/g.364794 Transcript_124907/m.364794 type:complete len:200 (-) Transcript_124907:299-898(-)